MIYAYSVLQGWTSMRGSASVHLPMLIAMLVFMNPYWGDDLPDQDDIDWAFSGAEVWARFGLIMHFILASLHIFQLSVFSEIMAVKTFTSTFQIISVIA